MTLIPVQVDPGLNCTENMTAFDAWWKTVDDDEVLEVQYPHKRHGLAGRPSNHTKTEAMEEFLEFVDAN